MLKRIIICAVLIPIGQSLTLLAAQDGSSTALDNSDITQIDSRAPAIEFDDLSAGNDDQNSSVPSSEVTTDTVDESMNPIATDTVLLAMPSTAVQPATSAMTTNNNQSTLNEQVQDLKQQILELNKDLFVLEEELLFPANTQISVFLSMNVGKFFQLDAVKLTIDDNVVTHYLYTEKQIDALHRGGVQRLYLGNLKTGEHEIVAVFTGKGPNERDYRRGATLRFNKTADAKKIELKLVDSTATQQPEFVVKEW